MPHPKIKKQQKQKIEPMIFRKKRNEFFYYKKKPQKSVIFFRSKHTLTKKNGLENEPNT